MKFTTLMMPSEDRFYHAAFSVAVLVSEVLKMEGKPTHSALVREVGWRIILAEFDKSKRQRARTLDQQEE